MMYVIKRKPHSLVLDIQLTKDGRYRPDTLLINGEVAVRLPEWTTSAGGNILYYAVNGMTYSIPQAFIGGIK